MNYVVKTLASGWIADTNAKLTAYNASCLASAAIPGGAKLQGVARYVSLHLPPSPSDITESERDAILGSGLALLLVQHVLLPGWVADFDNGSAQGAAAAGHAKLIGYPQGAHLAVDMEGLKNTGQGVIDFLRAWCAEAHAAGYKTLCYVGYCCGLTPQQLSGLSFIDLFWADFGPRENPPGKGFCMKQHPQSELAGVGVDLDEVHPDLRGLLPIAMGLEPAEYVEVADPAAQANDPAASAA